MSLAVFLGVALEVLLRTRAKSAAEGGHNWDEKDIAFIVLSHSEFSRLAIIQSQSTAFSMVPAQI